MSTIELNYDGWSLKLLPGSGAAVYHLSYAGQSLLREVPSMATHVSDQGAFSMIPFCGRIRNGRFVFADEVIQLASNWSASNHPIHGHLWLMPWQVRSQGPSSVRFAAEHSASDWPWSYAAEHWFELHDKHLRIGLSVHNQSATPMPAGLGWHPFFRLDGARLVARVQQQWFNDAEVIPLGIDEAPDRPALEDGVSVSRLSLDNAFEHDGTPLYLSWPDWPFTLSMTSDPLFGRLVIYTPDDADFFCVEPVSHIPNGFNVPAGLSLAQTGVRTLAPGERMQGEISLRIHV